MRLRLILSGLALLSGSASLSAETAGEETEHVVAAGETLGGIANRAGIASSRVIEANSLTPPYVVKVGQKLLIPRTRHHKVEPGDTGFGLSYRFAVPWQNIAIANGIEPGAPLLVGQDLLIPTVLDTPSPASAAARFIWPLAGSIHRGFRSRAASNFHDGLDIEAAEGSAVRAAAAGTVIFAGKEKNQFGNLVVIDHGNEWHSAYGSLGGVTVKKGDKVTQGERVGLVGDTSVTSRTELHFELRQDGKPVDPLGELPSKE